MKITRMEMLQVRPRWMVLKIHTDEGIVGYGEPVLEARTRTVEMAVREFEPILIGADPMRIEHLWQTMYRGVFYRGGPILMSAISGIEMALWDIKGKYYNTPVYELLGGRVRDRIRMYGHIKKTAAVGANTIEDMVAWAYQRKLDGYTAVKYSIIPPIKPIDNLVMMDAVVERFAAIREAVGKSVDIAIDFHGRVNPAMSIRLAKALEPYYPLFIEEPVLPENADVMATVARSTTIPIAAGERHFTKWGFRELFERQAIAVAQPDICHCGGIFEARKIAAMAETYYIQMAPHNPLGPISLAACLQLDACTPNFLVQEHPGMPDKMDLGVGVLKKPFVVDKDGYIAVPDGPGLGVEVDDEALEALRYDGSWDVPRIAYEDGSFADW